MPSRRELLDIEIFPVLIASGVRYTAEGIEYKGKLWVVPEWDEYPEEHMLVPKRMIRFDNLLYQSLNPNEGTLCRYAVNMSIPRAVLYGQSSVGFETLAGKDITFGVRCAKEVGH